MTGKWKQEVDFKADWGGGRERSPIAFINNTGKTLDNSTWCVFQNRCTNNSIFFSADINCSGHRHQLTKSYRNRTLIIKQITLITIYQYSIKNKIVYEKKCKIKQIRTIISVPRRKKVGLISYNISIKRKLYKKKLNRPFSGGCGDKKND